MATHPDRPEIRLQLTLLDNGQLEVWSRDPMPTNQLAEILHKMAHKFETGKVNRVR